MSGIQAQAIGNKAAKDLIILVSNRTSEQYTPQLFIDSKRYKGNVIYRYVANERLNATNGGNAEMEGSGEIQVRVQEWGWKGNRTLHP